METEEGEVGYARRDDYASRMPSPPRIHIPPAYLDPLSMPKVNFISPIPGLFDGLNLNYPSDFGNLLHWNYDRRHEAQEVLPFLHLGPRTACKDQDFLLQQNFTMVLAFRHVPGILVPNFTQNAATPYLQAARYLGIQTPEVEVGDFQQMVSLIPTLVDEVNDNLNTAKRERGFIGKVLVVCETGNDRAAFFTIAYLMHITDLELVPAIQTVHSARFCIVISNTLQHSLAAEHDRLTAKRQVAENSARYGPKQRKQSIMCNIPASDRGSLSGRKRSFQHEAVDGDQDAQMEVDNNQDPARSFAPFASQ
ncbi:MAG: hypothetical protein M1831_003168 [Alyxoria varia]|nr:MAG: hypothetical protein M1831_003168 [Alyxoria varia]